MYKYCIKRIKFDVDMLCSVICCVHIYSLIPLFISYVEE